jgi:hypothetical protein
MPPTYFADTFYWIALIFPRDAFHAAVASFSRTLGSARLVTTDEVVSEVLSHFAGLGPYWRVKSRLSSMLCAAIRTWTYSRKAAPISTPRSSCTKRGRTKGIA